MCCDHDEEDKKWREPAGNNCGQTAKYNTYILGGSSADPGFWGWAASLREYSKSKTSIPILGPVVKNVTKYFVANFIAFLARILQNWII